MENRLSAAIDSAKEGKKHLLFMDAAHFVLGAFLCNLWSMGRVFIPSSAGRNRINVLGVVNAITKQVTTLVNTDYIAAVTIMDFLNQIKKMYWDKPIIIVLDNARYQHCEAVKLLAEKLGIELMFLPPYSANLNIIERLWKYTKKEILNGRYYDTPKKFHHEIKAFFQNINRPERTEKLMTLLSLKFQILDAENAHSYAA